MSETKELRCAIYTRKSSEEGLEQDFNSLHAQREACEAYVQSQKHEGWKVLPVHYDDGGFSGGNMERPALKHLLEDIRHKMVDVVVVYKIDRLTRSLMDFSRIVDVFDKSGVSFVSVTQQFNTTTSMGRLTLNVLLSFAQFEREVTSERIRDKIRASKAKGMWMGGGTPLGYDVKGRTLVVNEAEAKQVRWLFSQYALLGSPHAVLEAAVKRGYMGKKGKPMDISTFRFMLRNPVYIGKIKHKELLHPGLHEAIVDKDLFRQVQKILDSRNRRTGSTRNQSRNLLVGRVEDEAGGVITPIHTLKKGKRYHYYVSSSLLRHGADKKKGWRIPAYDIESLVLREVRQLLELPARLASAVPAPCLEEAMDKARVFVAGLDGAGRNALVRQLVNKVVVGEGGLHIHVSCACLCEGKKVREQIIPVEVKLRKCGRDMRLVLSNGLPAHGKVEKDAALIKAVERAERWFDDLLYGKENTVVELAKRDGVRSAGYIHRMLPCALLAPDIRAAIMEGKQPAELCVQRLTRMTVLPRSWDEQRKLLGFVKTHDASKDKLSEVRPWLSENSDQFASVIEMMRM